MRSLFSNNSGEWDIILAAEWTLCAWTWSHLSSVFTSEFSFQDCV